MVKSTWIEQNGLKQYALSADDIRMMCSSPQMMPDGTHAINQANNGVVWKTLFNILETRMRNGEFTVIDATNSKTAEMNRYKKMCDEYRFRMFCVDFPHPALPLNNSKTLMIFTSYLFLIFQFIA